MPKNDSKTVDAASILADYVVNARYKSLPHDAIEHTKLSILDTIGCILAGSGLSPVARSVVRTVLDAGGKEESTVLAFNTRVPSWIAAFANGSLGHALDYDDCLYETMVHPTMSTFPAALAAAELSGNVRGQELITAIAVANDLICRLSLAVMRASHGIESGWNYRQLFGYFSAAAAAGKMIGLDREHMSAALGIASQMAAGTNQVAYETGGNFRAIYPAPVGFGGVLSAVLASKGTIGPAHSLEGRAGVLKMYFANLYDRAALTADLGVRYECANIGYKPWACCSYTHTFIDSTLQLVKEHDIKPDDILEIIVYIDDNSRALCEPLEMRQAPPREEDAKWSLPWVIACAVARRQVVLADFFTEALSNKATLELARKVVPKFGSKEASAPANTLPGTVEIRTRAGAFSKRVLHAYGESQNPMTKEDLVAKFRDCAAYSAQPVVGGAARVQELIERLDQMEDIRDLIKLL